MKKIKYFIIFLICISCNKKDDKIDKDKYQILNLVYRDYSKYQMEFFVFPAKRPPIISNSSYERKSSKLDLLNKKDTLAKIKNYIEKKENQKIFAFDTIMKRYHNIKDIKLKEKTVSFDNLYKNFVTSEKVDYLDIYKISPQNNDSIIVFKNKLLKRTGVEFQKFNVLVSFSDIAFNEDLSKAIIIGTRSFSRTDSHSSIYFFKKKNGKWKKTFEQAI